MKKEIALLLVFSLLVILFCGCAQKKGQPQETAEEISAAELSSQPLEEAPSSSELVAQDPAKESDRQETVPVQSDEDPDDLQEQELPAENEESGSKEAEKKLSALIDTVSGMYRYSNGEAYLCIFDNHTYSVYDFDWNTDGIVRFWSKSDDSTMVLYDENGDVSDTLFAEGTYDRVTVTNSKGLTLKPFEYVMNGTYDCLISVLSYSKPILLVMQELPFWVSDETAASLEVGSVLNDMDMALGEILVDSMEKKTDSLYLINGEIELARDDAAGAWRLSTDRILLQQIGRCSVDEKTELVDQVHNGEHKTLEECLAFSGSVEARVNVKDGYAVKLEIMS